VPGVLAGVVDPVELLARVSQSRRGKEARKTSKKIFDAKPEANAK
jgi:hypothetical protein